VGSVHSKSVFPPINPPTISIVGGTPAAEGEFPYVVTRIAIFQLIRNCFVAVKLRVFIGGFALERIPLRWFFNWPLPRPDGCSLFSIVRDLWDQRDLLVIVFNAF
jgi:hypothetical protein